MFPEAVKNYVTEINRVLKPGGRVLLTFFLLNPESENLMRKAGGSMDFKYSLGDCFTTDQHVPERAVAYTEDFVRSLLKSCRLDICEPIHLGSWCGRERFLSYQDILVATKKNSE